MATRASRSAGKRTETVSNDESIKVGGNRTETVSGNESVKVSGALDLRASGALNLAGSFLGLNSDAACRPVAESATWSTRSRS